MAQLTDLIARVDTALGDGTAFQREPAKATELARQRADLAAALSRTEDEWLLASADLEEGSI